MIVSFLLVLISMAIAVAGIYFIRKRKWYPLLEENSQYAAYVYSIVGGIYGVLLAFIIVVAWQDVTAAKQSVTEEVSNLSMLSRNAIALPEPIYQEIHDKLLDYSNKVVNKEWHSMATTGWKHDEANEAYVALWYIYKNYQPQNKNEEFFLEASIQQLNLLGTNRRIRLMNSRSGLPTVMWLFLIIGAIVTIAFSYLFWTRQGKLQAIIVAMLTGLIVSSLILTYSLQHPFKGNDPLITTDAFILLVDSLNERKEHKP